MKDKTLAEVTRTDSCSFSKRWTGGECINLSLQIIEMKNQEWLEKQSLPFLKGKGTSGRRGWVTWFCLTVCPGKIKWNWLTHRRNRQEWFHDSGKNYKLQKKDWGHLWGLFPKTKDAPLEWGNTKRCANFIDPQPYISYVSKSLLLKTHSQRQFVPVNFHFALEVCL